MNDLRKKIDFIDQKMQQLFLERMHVVKEVALYKKANHLDVYDQTRELEIIKKNLALLNDLELAPYYETFFKELISLSKQYQREVIDQ